MSIADRNTVDPRRTALVLIDLQQGIVDIPRAPHPVEQVVARAKKLAARFRAAGSPVVLVRVGFAPDYADAPPAAVDEPMPLPPGGLPAHWTQLVPGLEEPGDLLITKRQWGAFHGTELDLQLRRRGIDTLVLGGIATNFGVESTARAAWEHGYRVVVIEDACSSGSAELHAFAIQKILPRIARVLTADELVVRA